MKNKQANTHTESGRRQGTLSPLILRKPLDGLSRLLGRRALRPGPVFPEEQGLDKHVPDAGPRIQQGHVACGQRQGLR